MQVTAAREEDADALCLIERAALGLLRGHRAWVRQAALPIPPSTLQRAIARGLVWVARDLESPDAPDEPRGFIWLDDVGVAPGGIAIAELDVDPRHGRRGIGAALLEHAVAWARAAGYRRIDLATLADVPWNAPFYAHHGFTVMAATHPDFAWLAARDRANGMAEELRVFMRRALPPLAAEDWTTWPAPAKLNLFLRILGRRADGYHLLQTVFRLLDWGDEIHVRVRGDGRIRRVGEVPDVAPEDDLTLRAARLLQAHAGVRLGADIALRKRVPPGGGLGGGSSDAATVLVALDHLWRIGLGEDALAELGRQLGADVPVFVRGRTAWATGIGDELVPLVLPRRHYVVVNPRVAVSTARLFQAPQLTRDGKATTISAFVSGETTDNAFAPVARELYPAVAGALDWLGRFGQARLSGSGGCCFLETRSFDRARAVARQCPPAFAAHAVSGLAESPLRRALERHAGAACGPASAAVRMEHP